VQFIVLHFTAEELEDSLRTLTRGNVSSHYLVGRNPPTIYRLVAEDRRAWHAGHSYWQGQTALNASSVGIEIVNPGDSGVPGGVFQPYAPAQIDQVVRLVRDIERRHGVRPHRVLGHSDVQPQTKQDPGPAFPWHRLAEEGLIPWPDPAQVSARLLEFQKTLPDIAWFQQRLAQHGFEVPTSGSLDLATRNVIGAFQMKYRPACHDGQPDAETAALLAVVSTPGGLRLRAPGGEWQTYQP
jgi:N-acetylmuramoyl-L-alanine amidase